MKEKLLELLKLGKNLHSREDFFKNLKVYYAKEVTSTNNWAKQLAAEDESSEMLVVTDFQSFGKGRRGRTWVAPKGKDIFMSLLLRPEIKPAQASMLTLVMGFSVVQTLNEVLEIKSQIKWPNDIVYNGKKLCGILTEMKGQADSVEYVIIGTGINCNTQEFKDKAVENAISLAVICGEEVDRTLIIAAVINAFAVNYEKFLASNDLTALINDYNNVLVNKDREVRVYKANDSWTGVARGINKRGELLVEDSEGDIQRIFSGEVSVRGMDGYV